MNRKNITAVMLFASLFGAQIAAASINGSLDFGATGQQVIELQTYLATNASIYPSGLVTGYFGPLTQAGVQRFQTAQGIVSSGTPESTGYGRVGPLTMARLNALMGSGSQVSWDTVPYLYPPTVQTTSTTATVRWTTNEPTDGQVYWSDVPLQFNEATGPRQQPFVSGTQVLDVNGMQISHSVTISNLQPNKLYHFLVRSIDSVGNMSMVWPSTFQTNQ